jgi:hypothetical protein
LSFADGRYYRKINLKEVPIKITLDFSYAAIDNINASSDI